MSRSPSAVLLAVAALAAGVPLAHAQNTAEVRDLVLPVLDLDITTVSLDDTVSRSENGRRIDVSSRPTCSSRSTGPASPAARAGASARRPRRSAPAHVKRATVAGYTDAKGSEAYNLGLSRRRAQAVADELRRRLGAGAVALTVRGRGEADPVASNAKKDGSDDPKGRAKNRRVEITFPKRG